MKIKRISASRTFGVLMLVILGSPLSVQNISAQNWYNSDWPYRCTVTVPGLSSVQTDFQVKIALNSSFDFISTENDGSDIRITAADGTTELPFWIEEWNKAGSTGTIWVKLPSLPVEGLTVYLYYGNPAPVVVPVGELLETPPAGPFTKHTDNPGIINGVGAPLSTESILPENIIYDAGTELYWMVLSDQTGGPNVGLVYSDDPTNPEEWYWSGYPITGNPLAIAPHLMEHNGTWYLFYGDRAHGTPYQIAVATSADVDGPYTYLGPVLTAGAAGTWEDERVDEPFVFWNELMSKWILMYMGDAGGDKEQVGYATADNITGPYTKYASNPCIPFGPAGTYDAGTVANPWVYEYDGVYYIGYTASPTNASPWETALATTTDWVTFTKRGVILPKGSEFNSFRGAVTRIGDEYVFPYTGGPGSSQYRLCMATQPVYQYPPSYVNNGGAVFDFFDGFDANSLDLNKWSVVSGAGLSTVEAGLLSMNATSTFIVLRGTSSFPTGYASETRARHPSAGVFRLISEIGFSDANWNTLRIADYYLDNPYWQRQSKLANGADTWVNMAQTADRDWHQFSIYRESTGTAGFRIDANPVEVASANVPAGILQPFLMSYGINNQLIVDWTRVRKWAGADPITSVSVEEFNGKTWAGVATGDLTNWHNSLNWTGGIPTASDNVSIPGNLPNNPTISSFAECNNLIVDQTASLTLSPSGDLTVNGFLLNNGVLNISSTSVDNGGSLIVRGTSVGKVNFTRFFRPEINSGDRHFFSSPVGNLLVPDFLFTNTNLNQIWEWDELNATWPIVTSGSFESGRGYNLEQTDGNLGSYVFSGSVLNSAAFVATAPYLSTHTDRNNAYDYGLDNEEDIWSGDRSWTNYGGGGWNLMGNPFTSAMDATAFITSNSDKIDPNYMALYIYDGEAVPNVYRWAGTNIPGYPQPQVGSIGSVLQTGQGFFVLALYDGATFEFNGTTMQLHGNATVKLWKSARTDEPWPGLQLNINYGDKASSTQIVYNNAMTSGLDPGYDVGQLSNHPEVEIYTSLVEEDNSVNFARQALPVSGASQLVVPVGIDSENGGQVTFSAVSVPVGNYKFWLEDRTHGIFTDISTKTYSATLPAKTYGTGRFFILASANTPTGTEDEETDQGLRIWNSNSKIIIKGEVAVNSFCEIYDIQGKMLLKENLAGGELNSIDLPSGLHGVFMVRVLNGPMFTTKKVVIL